MTSHGGQDQDGPGTRNFVVAVLVIAIAASGLAALTVKEGLLTGRAPAVVGSVLGCSSIPDVSPDASPFIPGNALSAVLGLLPMLPVPNLGPVTPLDYNEYSSAGQYATFSSILLATQTRIAMEDNGFRSAATIGYEAGETFFGAEALQFGSPAQAAAFERRMLLDACDLGVASDPRPVAGLAGGVTFVYHDASTPPFRIVFLVGDAVLRLNLCLCVEGVIDSSEVLSAWAGQVDARIRAPLA